MTVGPAARGPVVVGLDIGSSGVRAVAFRSDGSRIATSSAPLVTHDEPGGASFQVWSEVTGAVRQCLRAVGAHDLGPAPVRVALSGVASSLVVVNGPGQPPPTTRLVMWGDTSAAASESAVAEFQRTHQSYLRTSCPPHITYWPAKLHCWSRQAGAPLDRASVRVGGVKDFVFSWLTGHWWTDPMTASSSGVFDSSSWRWEDELLAFVGLDVARLPELHEADESLPVLPSVAEDLGLKSDVQVVLGGMDGPLAQLGAAGRSTTTASCTVGTSLAMRMGSSERVLDPSGRLWCYAVSRDFFVLGGAGSNGGNLVEWLRTVLGSHTSTGDLLAEALARPLDPQLVFLPYLNGERSPLWSPDLSGCLVGMRPHHIQADLARAAVDAIGAALHELLLAFLPLVGTVETVELTGGLLQQDGWAQHITDWLGVKTTSSRPDVAVCAGVAALGFASMGQSVHPTELSHSGLRVRTRPVTSRTAENLRYFETFVAVREALFSPSCHSVSA